MKALFLIPGLLMLTNVISGQNRFDILITEIMADPSPQVGLPNYEWIELKNNSAAPINLQGWRIADSGGQSGAMPDYLLQAGSYIIVCSNSAFSSMSSFGNSIAVTSFPSLDNDGELIFLKDPSGNIIHALEYSSEWYGNALKKEGGWSLEMIDPANPCNGASNWKASINERGGTPASQNSVYTSNPDLDSPELKNAYVQDLKMIILVFNESLDSTSVNHLINYSVTDGIGIQNIRAVPPLYREVEITTTTSLTAGKIYEMTVKGVTDCSGNEIGSKNHTRFGLPSTPVAGDIVISEILFNPRPNAFDYVELYNRSDKIFDASKISLANRNSSQTISSIVSLTTKPYYLFPGDYIVATTNAASLSLHYHVKDPNTVMTLPSMPSFPDDKGIAIILNQQGEVLDELQYDEDWHFKLMSDPEGVALERVDVDAETQNPANWHSASSTSGYGTPGYKNSQARTQQQTSAFIEVLPSIFSPDNDGLDDIASIHYNIDEPGWMANLTIFDAAGRPVRSLVRNDLMGRNGYWNWDGLDDKGLKLPAGIYILFTEIFNLNGKKQVFKKSVVLAARLKN